MNTIMEALRELKATDHKLKNESLKVVKDKKLSDKLLEDEEICPKCGNKKDGCICEKCDEEIIEIVDDKEDLQESDKPAATSIEDAQKWVDYDMEKYGEISEKTNELVKKAGFQIVKDDHGDYEVVAGKFESLEESSERDDIDADADDKKEKAKVEFEKKEDDADADKDEKLDEAEHKTWYRRDNPEEYGVEIKTWDDFQKVADKDDRRFVGQKRYFDIFAKSGKMYFKDGALTYVPDDPKANIFCMDSHDRAVEIPETLTEDFESSKPVEILPKEQIIDFVKNVKPGTFFKLGVMRELNSEIASKFRGGRGSEETLPIRIVKCSESYVATGEDYEAQKETIARREQGIEKSERRTGFTMSEDPALKNKIFLSGKGESLAYYPRRGSVPKVKYFLSIDNGDLEEVSKQDIIPYLTPAQAAKLSGSQEKEQGETAPMANALKVNLDKIYYIGNLGHSIM